MYLAEKRNLRSTLCSMQLSPSLAPRRASKRERPVSSLTMPISKRKKPSVGREQLRTAKSCVGMSQSGITPAQGFSPRTSDCRDSQGSQRQCSNERCVRTVAHQHVGIQSYASAASLTDLLTSSGKGKPRGRCETLLRYQLCERFIVWSRFRVERDFENFPEDHRDRETETLANCHVNFSSQAVTKTESKFNRGYTKNSILMLF